MDSHSFCRTLLRTAQEDLRRIDPSFLPSSLTVTKSSLGGYEVQGSNRFYNYSNSACCKWSAKAEAVDKLIQDQSSEIL